MAADRTIDAGTRIGADLEVMGVLGAGGMGKVFLARDALLDRPVAVKLLVSEAEPEPDQTDEGVRAVREARAVARVVHPNVAAVYRIGQWLERPFIEMEYVDGPSLRQVLDTRPLPPTGTRQAWLEQIGAAVQHAHDCGIIHCDLKPENILLADDGASGRRVKLVDFGLARGRDLRHRYATQRHGTLAYLAPEAGLEAPSRAGDQYSLAMLAAETLTAERPARGVAGVVVDRRQLLPARAKAVLERGLAERPGDRFPTVGAFMEALIRALRAAPEPSMEPLADATPSLRHLRQASQLTPEWIAALPRAEYRDLVLALAALAPPGHPGLLERLLGELDRDPVVADLRDEQWLDGGLGEWQLRDRGLVDVVMLRVRRRSVAALRHALATALETSGGGSAWVREDAARLYTAAGRPGDAARLVAIAARSAVSAHDREHGLHRAVALLGTPTHLAAWLAAAVEHLEWTLRCGWWRVASGALSVAKGLAAEAPMAEGCRHRLLLAEAGLRLLAGRSADAGAMAERILAMPHGDVAQRLVHDHAAAIAAQARLTAGDAEGASGVLVPTLDAISRQGPAGPAETLAHGAVLRVGSRVLTALGRHPAAATLATRNLALQMEQGDPMGAAEALLAVAECHMQTGSSGAARQLAEEAEALLLPVGAVATRGEAQVLLARCALADGQHLLAMRHCQNGIWSWRGHGAAGPEREALTLMIDLCRGAGDEAGAWQHRAELDAARRASKGDGGRSRRDRDSGGD